MLKLFLIIFASFLMFSPAVADAALIYFDPPEVKYGVGDTFSAKIRVDNEGECINAVDIAVNFPADVVKVIDVGRGESIINLWIEDPKIDNENGKVTMTGGIPGGYCGRIEGDPGLTNLIAEIIFQTSDHPGSHDKRGVFDLRLDESSQVLLNDGLGTQANIALSNAQLVAGDPGSSQNVNWFDVLKKDTFPPDGFAVELYKDQGIIGGRYFIVFSTTDKQSGLDHFEIEESDLKREGFKFGTNDRSVWKMASSPYILEDQSLNSLIKVRAIDKAGNSRTVVYIPDESMRQTSLSATLKLILYSIFFVIPALSPLIVVQYRKRKKRQATLLVESESVKKEEN